METIKTLMNDNQIISTMITSTITALITLIIAGIVSKNKKIRNSVSKDDLDNGITKAKKYTDERIIEHEKEHKNISEIISGIRKDNERIESKVDKILFLLVKK